MNELIKIQPHNTLINAINARDIHEFLGVKRYFASWVKHRIDKFKLVGNRDFLQVKQMPAGAKGGGPRKEYLISLAIAKKFAEYDEREKSKILLEYFIEREKDLPKTKPLSPAELILNAARHIARKSY